MKSTESKIGLSLKDDHQIKNLISWNKISLSLSELEVISRIKTGELTAYVFAPEADLINLQAQHDGTGKTISQNIFYDLWLKVSSRDVQNIINNHNSTVSNSTFVTVKTYTPYWQAGDSFYIWSLPFKDFKIKRETLFFLEDLSHTSVQESKSSTIEYSYVGKKSDKVEIILHIPNDKDIPLSKVQSQVLSLFIPGFYETVIKNSTKNDRDKPNDPSRIKVSLNPKRIATDESKAISGETISRIYRKDSIARILIDEVDLKKYSLSNVLLGKLLVHRVKSQK